MTPPVPPAGKGEGGDSPLKDLLRERITARGPLSFAEFMENALYHPRWGYYARPDDPVGRHEGSDFYTAPSRHPAFGALVGRQVAECLSRLGEGQAEIVEAGPGSGALFVSVLKELERTLGPSWEAVRGTLVESNPSRAAAQRRRLAEAGFTRRLRWLTPEEWEGLRERLSGCILANEVLDAMPVHRLVCRNGGLQEVFVDWKEDLVETTGPVSRPEILQELERQGFVPREGQEVEVGLEGRRWILGLGSKLRRGYALLLDYGHAAPEIHSLRHLRGTLLAYYRHRVSENLLERVGLQDLTAHVNFTSVTDAAREAGFQVSGPVSQGRFLLALGALDLLGKPGERFDWKEYLDRKAFQDLFVPGGFGESHQVLALGTQGMDMDLTGLKSPDRWTAPATEDLEGAGPPRGEGNGA